MNTHSTTHLCDPQAFSSFRNLHEGETIVVCGCGQSLAGFQFNDQFVTIGVNDVGRLFDPDYLVVVNSRHQFANDRFSYVENSQAKAVFSQLDLGLTHPNQVRFRLGQRGGTDVSSDDALPYTRNSPYVAVCLALFMGARRIAMIGVDFTDNHFFDRTGTHALGREIDQINREYLELRNRCAKNGVELINLSQNSRVTAIPYQPVESFAPEIVKARPLNIVSYSTTPVAGVTAILGRTIDAKSPHHGRAVWENHGYSNGVCFDGDIAYGSDPEGARTVLENADVVIVHNGKVAPAHRVIIESKPVVTLAHNYKWNVDCQFQEKGYPALVVGQYQAVLEEFSGWNAVPNPLPYWEDSYKNIEKPKAITVCFTPSGKHEVYPKNHRLYWHAKGYDTTMRVLDKLVASHGIELEVIRDRQVSHAESIAMKARSHIVIDECVTGSYHRNSLEGLAAGAVVINGLGQLAGVEQTLLACAGDAGSHPFETCTLATLEARLTELIETGAEALTQCGQTGRAWIETHWDFATQWDQHFEPSIQRAIDHHATRHQQTAVPIVAPVEPIVPQVAPAQLPKATLDDLSVAIPFGGRDRLRNLEVVLKQVHAAGVGEIVVCESDTNPLARDLAARFGARHVFVPHHDGFHKARVMNVAGALTTCPRFVWLDADIYVDGTFLEQALAEMEARTLDCFVPWSSVHYLNQSDSEAVARAAKLPEACSPVNTYYTRQGVRGGVVLMRRDFFDQHGGVPEGFRGWGGEDNAFFHKSGVLGRAGVTLRSDQNVYHLYHQLSGGHGPNEAILSNPNYDKNLSLLKDLRRIGTAAGMAVACPPPEYAPSPWTDPIKLFCTPAATNIGDAIQSRYGPAVMMTSDENEASHSLDRKISRAPVSASEIADAVAELSITQNATLEPVSVEPASAPDEGLRLNLGCFDRPLAGFTNVDFTAGDGVDVVVDLREKWPWDADDVAHIEAHDVIEHLPNPIHTMNELWRVMRPKSRASLSVATTDGPGAFQDPTHVSFWNRNSFHYYEDGNPYRTRFASRYGIFARFRIVDERIERTGDGPVLHITLEKVP